MAVEPVDLSREQLLRMREELHSRLPMSESELRDRVRHEIATADERAMLSRCEEIRFLLGEDERLSTSVAEVRNSPTISKTRWTALFGEQVRRLLRVAGQRQLTGKFEPTGSLDRQQRRDALTADGIL